MMSRNGCDCEHPQGRTSRASGGAAALFCALKWKNDPESRIPIFQKNSLMEIRLSSPLFAFPPFFSFFFVFLILAVLLEISCANVPHIKVFFFSLSQNLTWACFCYKYPVSF